MGALVVRRAYSYVVLAALSVLLSGAAIVYSVHYYDASVAAQQRQGAVIESKLCTTLGALAALQPPAGSAAGNPSRAYEQRLHAVLAQLGPDIGCRRTP